MEANMLYVVDIFRTVDDYIPSHYHNCHEIVWYRAGEGFCNSTRVAESSKIDDPTVFIQQHTPNDSIRVREFKENSVLYFSPLELHDETHRTGGEVFAIGFTCSEPLNFSRDSYHSVPVEVIRCLNMIIDECRNQDYGYHESINSLLCLLATLLNRIDNRKPNDASIFSRIKFYIDNYYMTNITVESLAKSYFYTPTHFIRAFKKAVGIHPKQYILSKRLDASINYLENTALPFRAIAKNVGFNNNSDFSSFIKRMTGLSPTQIRNNALTGNPIKKEALQIPGDGDL